MVNWLNKKIYVMTNVFLKNKLQNSILIQLNARRWNQKKNNSSQHKLKYQTRDPDHEPG